MIDSMTNSERRDPKLLLKSPNRRKRIAVGSGYTDTEVDKMINDFEKMRNMMQGIASGDFSKLTNNPLVNKAGSKQTKQQKYPISQITDRDKKKEVKKRKGFLDL